MLLMASAAQIATWHNLGGALSNLLTRDSVA
jgi:hypothetical protein